jgi:hypothetical protein
MKKACLLALFLLAAVARAQFGITRIEPGKADERLCATVWMQDAFSIKIEETIRSGLPALMDLRILLRDQNLKSVFKTTITFQIQCDVWKEEYRVERPDLCRFFTSFDSVQIYFQSLPELPVIDLKKLDPQEKYCLWMQAEVMPISKIQSDKVKDWLVESDEDAQLSGGQRSAGGNLSLSNLIVSVFSREKKRELETGWSRSAFFMATDLK